DRWFKSSPRNQLLPTAETNRVYELQNREGRLYIGLYKDVTPRVEEHNSGQSPRTNRSGPWTEVWRSEELSLTEARKMENRQKRQGRGKGFYAVTGLRGGS